MSPDQGVLLEVCVESPAGAVAAQAGGADRVELCTALVEGGLTPSIGALEAARSAVDIPIVVMIRPRGGDFCYDDSELEVMKADVRRTKAAGANAVVLGILLPDGSVDRERTARLIELAQPMQVTFHRAFDMTRDPEESLERLIGLGVGRVLTSGQAPTVMDGLDRLTALVQHAGERIVVMPGGGVRERNIREVVEATGAREVHFTAGVRSESTMEWRNPACRMGPVVPPGEYERIQTDPGLVRQYREALQDHS